MVAAIGGLAILAVACSIDAIEVSSDSPDALVAEATVMPVTLAPTVSAEATVMPAPTATADSDDVAEEPTPVAPVDTPVVFNGDFSTSIQPIIVNKCASCHAAGGPGAVHWQLGTAQDLVDTHLMISNLVDAEYMPPWPASDLGVPFAKNRSLRSDELQALLDWSLAGAPLDVDPATPLPPADGVNRLTDPDLIIEPDEPYAGDPATKDDYRCLVYDPQLEEGAWITGYEFLPDQLDVVHHAVGTLLKASAAERAKSLAQSDERPGWECFGGDRLPNSDLFLGWAPGQDATEFPDNTGLYLEPGDFIVVQIHYHYEGSAPADASQVALRFADPAKSGDFDRLEVAQLLAPVEIPCASWEEGPLCDRDAALADAIDRFGADGVFDDLTNVCGYDVEDFAEYTDGVVSAKCPIPAGFVDASGEVLAVLGHMHEIGDWLRITINPGEEDELVLLDIPDWDFDWQYNYVPVDPITIAPTDIVQLECGWDRARRDASLEPAYILWADGTDDEMCFATLTLRR